MQRYRTVDSKLAREPRAIALAIAIATVWSGCAPGPEPDPEPAASEISAAEIDATDTINSFDISAGGRKFRINGVATFLLGVSYFTGLAAPAATIRDDFTRLHTNGFNLVRVWALWNNQSQGGPKIELFNSSGVINAAAMNALIALLDAAKTRNIIVDLTFDKGYYPLMSVTTYRNALDAVADRIAGYRGVLIDIANEVVPGVLTQADVGAIRAQLPLYPNRIATASVGIGLPWGDHHIPLLSSYVTTGRLDVADAHCCRDDAWPTTTTQMVNEVRADACCVRKPIYFSEPNRCRYPGIGGGGTEDCSPANAARTLADFKNAAGNCRAADCAGWVFHTAASYFLNLGTLRDEYRFPVEATVEDQLAGSLATVNFPD